MEYLEPWCKSEEEKLVAELRREVPKGHVLFDVPVRALARRQDRDDVLFELADGSGRLVEVHLSWQVETNPNWPSAKLFESFESWLESMRCDHEEYVG